jgi:hypothetical protein
MKRHKLYKPLAIAAVVSVGLSVSSLAVAADVANKRLKGNQIGLMGPAPKAQCGRWDWTESGLQGQTTTWERESGDSEGGYNCNLELVGQYQGQGAYSQKGPAFFDHCAYMANQNNPLQEHAGIV